MYLVLMPNLLLGTVLLSAVDFTSPCMGAGAALAAPLVLSVHSGVSAVSGAPAVAGVPSLLLLTSVSLMEF
jgi:hypothetical protein